MTAHRVLAMSWSTAFCCASSCVRMPSACSCGGAAIKAQQVAEGLSKGKLQHTGAAAVVACLLLALPGWLGCLYSVLLMLCMKC